MDCGSDVGKWNILRIATFIYVVLSASFCGSLAWGRSADKGAGHQVSPCRQIVFAQVEHVVCEIDLRHYQINLHWKDAGGVPYGALGAVERELEHAGRQPIVTMNAGMYESDLSPVGLFIVGGRELSPANLGEGKGNFYLKPNGVFYVKGQRAGVMETKSFVRSGYKPDIATQSGPLLVAKGRIHSSFQPDGASRKIRNGVGVRRDGVVVLVISRQGISFGQFARLFRDELRCPDALYLDGSVSRISLYGEEGRVTESQPTLLSGRWIGQAISISKPR